MSKPATNLGIGVDAIPEYIKNSSVFDGNDMGKLGTVETLPTIEEVSIFVKTNFAVKSVLSADDAVKQQKMAKQYLNEGDVITAWKILLAVRLQ